MDYNSSARAAGDAMGKLKLNHYLRKFLGACATISSIGAITLFALSDPDALRLDQVALLVQELNEAAAVGVPHGLLLSASKKQEHQQLLEKVEKGVTLSERESRSYRSLYQAILQDNQRFLSFFDAELTVLHSHAMSTPNNVGDFGIIDKHDHHDLSARKNFAALIAELTQLESASNSLSRIRHANSAQKQLVDLISHLGVMPHTVSVPYEPPQMPVDSAELARPFEAMMQAYKTAQFSNVNSPAYWLAVDKGMQDYSTLILAVQARIWAHTSPWERRIAGRFLAFQTGAPLIDYNRPLRNRFS